MKGENHRTRGRGGSAGGVLAGAVAIEIKRLPSFRGGRAPALPPRNGRGVGRRALRAWGRVPGLQGKCGPFGRAAQLRTVGLKPNYELLG
ncbi:MAG: hypothetical protein MUC60_12490 [Oscillatoria sp. Prado101]|nr:hypothetical protein [Oscillatoria sp. Prado101]